MAGWLIFAAKRQKRERAQLLALHAKAARGDPKEIKKQLKEAERE